MKRLISLTLAAMMVVGFTACSRSVPGNVEQAMNQPDSQSTAKSQNNGKKLLFVEGRDTTGDRIVVKRLQEVHGMDVTVLMDKELTTENANGYSLIYISESVNSNKISNKLVKLPIPVIYAEPQSTSDTGMTVTEGFGKLDAGNIAKAIAIKDSKHQLAAGLSGSVDVYKDNGKMGYASPGSEAIVVATVPNSDQNATIFAYDKGAKNAKGDPVVAREVFLYLMNGEEFNQNENGWKLFDAAVNWAIGKK